MVEFDERYQRMKISNLFRSPVLIPFVETQTINDGVMGILITYRESAIDEIKNCVYLARSTKELRKKIRELHRVQVTMGQRINVPVENINTAKAFLVYSPISDRFTVDTTYIIINKTGHKLPIRVNRWIMHRKKNIFF